MRVIGDGQLIIVGGHCRGVGKTTVIEHLLRRSPHEAWVAVKISAHRHTPGPAGRLLVEEDDGRRPDRQTGRYLAAGARRAWLCHAADAVMPMAAQFVAGLRASGMNVIVESNRLVQHAGATTAIFVLSPPLEDWKPSSAALVAAADAFVIGPCAQRGTDHWPVADGHIDGRPLFTLTASGPLDAWYHTRHTPRPPASQSTATPALV
ncbi:MAG: hypothetical protein Q8L86_01345 [Vicinamibacterales bacterium]|nr:hypothetical protein [Vicinamibacterales bacterium]